MLSRVHLMCDGSPNDILKVSLNIMLGSASRDESMESVMVESTVGPAIIEKVYSYIVHLTYILVTYMLLNFQTHCLYTLPCSYYQCSVQVQ